VGCRRHWRGVWRWSPFIIIDFVNIFSFLYRHFLFPALSFLRRQESREDALQCVSTKNIVRRVSTILLLFFVLGGMVLPVMAVDPNVAIDPNALNPSLTNTPTTGTQGQTANTIGNAITPTLQNTNTNNTATGNLPLGSAGSNAIDPKLQNASATNPTATTGSTAANTTATTNSPGCNESDRPSDTTKVKAWEDGCKNAEINNLKKMIGQLSSLLVSFFTPIIAILAAWIGDVMGNSFVMGDMYATGAAGNDQKSVGELLHAVWMIFRDIMNYIFILILVFIAFMNVIPKGGGGKFKIGDLLPKLVMAIVVINFTWFGAQVILDASTIATHVIYGIPDEIAKSYPEAKIDKCEMIEKKIQNENKKDTIVKVPGQGCMVVAGQIYFDKDHAPKSGTQADPNNLNKDPTTQAKFKDIDPGKIIDYGTVVLGWGDFDKSKFKDGSIAQFFAFNIMQIQNLPMVVPGENVGWSALFINSLAALILMILVLVIFFSLFVALVARVVILWVNIILSPFMGLLMFKDDFGISTGGADDYIGLNVFVKNAFLPAMMGIPLVLGFIIINTGQTYHFLGYDASGATDIANSTATASNNTDFTHSIIEFAPGQKFINGIGNIHQLFWYIMAIMIMWMSMEIGKGSNGLAGLMITPVADGVKNIGQWIATSPMYINFIPVTSADGKKTTLVDLHSAGVGIPNILRRNIDNEQNMEAEKLFPGSSSSHNPVTSKAALAPEIQRKLEAYNNDDAKLNQIWSTLNNGTIHNSADREIALRANFGLPITVPISVADQKNLAVVIGNKLHPNDSAKIETAYTIIDPSTDTAAQ